MYFLNNSLIKLFTATFVPSDVRSPLNQKNIITRAEVAEHATQNDLWMIIKGNVYDITEYPLISFFFCLVFPFLLSLLLFLFPYLFLI